MKRRPREWNAMLFYYSFYKQGLLPQPGAVMDQANKAMAVFRIFDDVNAECDKQRPDPTPARPKPQANTGPRR